MQQVVNNVIPVATGVVQQTTRWIRHYWGRDEAGNPLEPLYGTNAPFICGSNGFPDGRPYEDTLIDLATGNTINSVTGCETPGNTTPGGPGVAVQPPPTPEEVWNVTPVPVPTFGISPHVDGLTGMETRLWDPRGTAPISVSTTIRGYTTTATALPSRWEWNMGAGGRNPNPVLVASRPGTEADPAARYTYETKGDYSLTLTVRWSGTYTFTGPGGGPPQTVDLGSTTRSSTRPYHVAELRPVLEAAGRS